ncbi:MAG: 2-amino-4-oxopentanoate thiolase subunit OrtA [bacterium]
MDPERAARGAWVEIHAVILSPGERAPNVPADTRALPLELRVRGFLVDDAAVRGDGVAIRTRAGRVLRGRLVAIQPGYDHGFGAPVPALAEVGEEARALLASAREERR